MTNYYNRYTIFLKKRGGVVKKSVYSLVLLDEVIEAIDELAYAHNTSRSNLINQLLAKHVALVTPESYLKNVFDDLSARFKTYTKFQVQSQAAENMYSIKTSLKYKYNPTIKYNVYLVKKGETIVGQLKVISRTQSELLYNYLDAFFKLWNQIENLFYSTCWIREEGAKWLKELNMYDKDISEEDLAKELYDYITLLNEGLRIYFSYLNEPLLQHQKLLDVYKTYNKSVIDRT